MHMNAKHAKTHTFDAGRTGLFQGSCLLRGRNPEYSAAQASPHTPALGCGSGRRHYSGRRGFRDEEGNGPRAALRSVRFVPSPKSEARRPKDNRNPRPESKVAPARQEPIGSGICLTRKRKAAKATQHQGSWWLQDAINSDGRRVITLWRRRNLHASPAHTLRRSRPAVPHRAPMKLRVRIAPIETPVVVPVEVRGGRAGAIPGPVGHSAIDLPPTPTRVRSMPRSTV
jgi:hypothetical protein